MDSSGKLTFADDLAAAIRERPVIVIHADDFLNLREIRHRRGRSPRKVSGSTRMTTRPFAAFIATARRMSRATGPHPDPEHQSMRRYVGGQRLYFKAAEPWQRATRAVDNTDPEMPRIPSTEEVL